MTAHAPHLFESAMAKRISHRVLTALGLLGQNGAEESSSRVWSAFRPLQSCSASPLVERKASVRVLDQVLSKTELAQVEAEIEAYLTLPGRNVCSNGDDETQVTRFLSPGERPRCAIEAAVSTLASERVTGAAHSADFCGCEWWIQHRKADEPQAFHVDADVGLQVRGDGREGESGYRYRAREEERSDGRVRADLSCAGRSAATGVRACSCRIRGDIASHRIASHRIAEWEQSRQSSHPSPPSTQCNAEQSRAERLKKPTILLRTPRDKRRLGRSSTPPSVRRDKKARVGTRGEVQTATPGDVGAGHRMLCKKKS